MEKHYNSSSTYSMKVGGTLPFLLDAVKYRVHGAEVKNTLVEGEKIAAGTPVEYTLSTHQAKFLKVWKVKSVEADASNGTTVVTLFKNAITPKITATTVVMVAPSTIAGTGKAVAVGTLTETDTTISFTVTTTSIDSVTANALLVEAAEAGSAKAMYCKPGTLSVEDIIAGGIYTLVDVPVGIVHAHQNCANPYPDAVLANLNDSILMVWEWFNETNA
jgi:hypothetical protein